MLKIIPAIFKTHVIDPLAALLHDNAKIAVLIASLLSITGGFIWLKYTGGKRN